MISFIGHNSKFGMLVRGKRVNEMKSWYKKFIGTIEPDSRGFNIREVLKMKNIIEFIIKKASNSYMHKFLLSGGFAM